MSCRQRQEIEKAKMKTRVLVVVVQGEEQALQRVQKHIETMLARCKEPNYPCDPIEGFAVLAKDVI